MVKALKRGCVAMYSTDPGAYGDPKKNSEVPRVPLLAALSDATQGRLARSDQVGAGRDPTPDPALGALDPVFVVGAGGYIDTMV